MTLPNLYASDPVLRKHLERRVDPGAMKRAEPALHELGDLAATRIDPLAHEANANPPVLERYDRDGERVDEVVHHPSYEAMRKLAYDSGLVWRAYAGVEAGGLPRPAVFALDYVFAQAEQGLYCPVCLTDGTALLVDRYGDDALQEAVLPHLLATERADRWEGAMLLTEKVGGSDVGANEAQAVRADDGTWRIHGEKWFCSNANAEAFCVLARPDGAVAGTRGLALFLVPRRLEDGTGNHLRIERLKDKLGTRSMATGEMRFDGAVAYELGGPGQGFKQMLDMLDLSRLHNSIASAAVARRALVEAVRYARERKAFGALLRDHPLQRAVLLDMALEWEGSLVLSLETAAAMEAGWFGEPPDEAEAARFRLITPLAKIQTAKVAVWCASEACEALGGNGYVEDFPTARLLRDAHVLPIWEGTTNVLSLDVLRALAKDRAHVGLLTNLRERLLDAPGGIEDVVARLEDVLADLERRCDELPTLERPVAEVRCRALAFDLADATTAVLLAEAATDERGQLVAEGYLELKLGGGSRDVRDRLALEEFDTIVDGAVLEVTATTAGRT